MALTDIQSGQLGQIPGIGTDVSSIKGYAESIPGIGADVTDIKSYAEKIPDIETGNWQISQNQLALADLIGGPTGVSGQVAGLGDRLLGDTVPINQNLAGYLSGQISGAQSGLSSNISGLQNRLLGNNVPAHQNLAGYLEGLIGSTGTGGVAGQVTNTQNTLDTLNQRLGLTGNTAFSQNQTLPDYLSGLISAGTEGTTGAVTSAQDALSALLGAEGVGGVSGQVSDVSGQVADIEGRLGLNNTVSADTNLAQYIQDLITQSTTGTTDSVAAAQTALQQLLSDEASQTRTDILGRLGTYGGGDLATRLNTGFSGITGTGTDTLTSLGQRLTGVGENLTGGLDVLSTGQAGIQSALTGQNGVGGIQGTLNDLGSSIGDYQTSAQTYREDMKNPLLGGQENITNALSQQNPASQLGQIATNVRRLQESQQQDFASVAAMISNNVPAQTNTDVVQRAQFIQLMNNLRGFVSNPQSGMNPTIQATYAALTNAFDPNGRLIAQSQSPTGTVTTRNLTADRRLVLQTANPNTGAISSPISLDINRLLNQAAATGATSRSAPTGLMAAPQSTGISSMV